MNSPFPLILPRNSHNISRKLIDPNALKIMYRLNSKGFMAYLVGGCVRDILLNQRPKDFDICTNARPSQLKKIFRNCRLIGRRFRLAHIIFKGNNIIEVSTFRREPENMPETLDRRKLAIHSNSCYGVPEEDAKRRDFTINALFYNLKDYSIIDYVGGIKDLQNKVIRIIGDPEKRFYEDPVRMMRGIEFAARLGFTLEDRTLEGIIKCKGEMRYAAPERVKEEMLEILKRGHGLACFVYFFDTGLFSFIFPFFQPWSDHQTSTLLAILKRMDNSLTPRFTPSDHLCFATLFWPFISEKLKHMNISTLNDIDIILSELVDPFSHYFHLKIHTRHLIKEIYRTIWRMHRGIGYKGEGRLVRKEFFYDALTLFCWLGECGQIDQKIVEDWKKKVAALSKPRRFWKRYKKKKKVFGNKSKVKQR